MSTPRKPPAKALQPFKQCRYCRAKFRPARNTQRFCKADHRKAFFKYGGLPYDKMRDQMRRDISAEVAPLLERIKQLEHLASRYAGEVLRLQNERALDARTIATLAAIAGVSGA